MRPPTERKEETGKGQEGGYLLVGEKNEGRDFTNFQLNPYTVHKEGKMW